MCQCICHILLSVVWTLGLILIAYPVAFFIGAFYILIQPLQEVCPACCEGPVEFFRSVMKWPLTFSEQIVKHCTCGAAEVS